MQIGDKECEIVCSVSALSISAPSPLLLQTVAIVLSALLVMSALLSPSSTTNLMRQPWFFVLVLVCGVERLAGIATGVAFERDWVMLVRQ